MLYPLAQVLENLHRDKVEYEADHLPLPTLLAMMENRLLQKDFAFTFKGYSIWRLEEERTANDPDFAPWPGCTGTV